MSGKHKNKVDYMELKAVDINPSAVCPKMPVIVCYKYHRYFCKATEGKGVRHIMAHAILN